MKIGGAYTVPMEPARAYVVLQDPLVLARCLPGCDRLERVAEDEYEMKMKMVISSVQGLFQGKVKIADQNHPDSFRLIVEGQGKAGFLKGEGLLTMLADGDGTAVQYDGEVQVGGMIASVGQRLLDATAKLVIRKFFEKLVAEVSEPAVEEN